MNADDISSGTSTPSTSSAWAARPIPKQIKDLPPRREGETIEAWTRRLEWEAMKAEAAYEAEEACMCNSN
jgi:hypothetical protein